MNLDRSLAPCNVQTMINIAGTGYYNGSTCHRLATSSGLKILQCGDPTGSGTGTPGHTVKDEPPKGLKEAGNGKVVYPRGTIAVAGLTEPNSGGGQFFIVHGDTVLEPKFAVIGTLDPAGMDIVDRVVAGGHDGSRGAEDGRPHVPLTITFSAFV